VPPCAQAWWYRQWVWQWIAQHRLGALQAAAQPTIGFHIRGGDVFEVDNEQVGLAAARMHAAHGVGPCGAVEHCAVMLFCWYRMILSGVYLRLSQGPMKNGS
jgi:hypothetical protein